MEKRETFGTRIGFILVSAGCAVGLGNVWKFPYICGQFGGAAFILVYLFFLMILGLPILICEFAVGRNSRRGISKAFDEIEQKGEHWHIFKWFGMAGNYLLMMYYSMVGGWMLYYLYLSFTGRLTGIQGESVSAYMSNQHSDMLADPKILIACTVLAVVVSLLICGFGVRNGVEKVSTLMMSFLIVLMVVLAIHSLVLEGAQKGVRFYLIPDWSLVEKNGIGNMIFAAMSHAFFTLSIGIGSMEIFGSYLNKDHTLVSEAGSVVFLDTFVALMAGFIIIPSCFAFGIEPDRGPSLLFVTLPSVFNSMPGGRIWGGMFFLFMSFAALSTIVAVYENILSFFMDGLGWARKKAIALNVVVIPLLSLPAILGFNLLDNVHPMGAGSNLMDLEDFLVSYNILPLGGLIFVLFCVRKNGWGWEGFLAEVNQGKGLKLPSFLKLYMAIVVPVIIIVVYLYGYYDTFCAQPTQILVCWMAFACLLLAVTLCISVGAFARILQRR